MSSTRVDDFAYIYIYIWRERERESEREREREERERERFLILMRVCVFKRLLVDFFFFVQLEKYTHI